MRQRCSGCVLCLGCPESDPCRLHGLIALLRHISPHNACVVRVGLRLGGGVHIWGAFFVCTHSCRCSRFDWHVCHCNPTQGIFLRKILPNRWWSRSCAPGSWGDVERVVSPHIQCQSHQRLRQIECDAAYGSRDQLLWMPHSIPPSQDVCTREIISKSAWLC